MCIGCSHRVSLLKTTEHPEYPTRCLLLCKDASVRLVSPKSGNVLTTLLMPPKRILVDAAYAIAQGTVVCSSYDVELKSLPHAVLAIILCVAVCSDVGYGQYTRGLHEYVM